MFADIVGFTELSEQIGSERAYFAVTGALRLLDGVARRRGGAVDKYLGDCLMVVFGHPVPIAEPATAAVTAAIEMREQVRAYGRALELDALDLVIGVNTGAMVAGDVRGGVVREFHVLGDAVNVAARLKARAPRGGIYVGPETHDETCAHFEYRPLGSMRLKGKDAEVAIFDLTGAYEHRAGAGTGTTRDPSVPFVGRARELARIAERLADLAAGRGSVVVVSGDEGVGKSRLLAEVETLPLARDARLVHARPGVAAETRDGELWADLLGACGAAAANARDALAGGATNERSARPVPGARRRLEGDAAAACIAEGLRCHALDRPCAVVLEDLDRADPRLARAPARRRRAAANAAGALPAHDAKPARRRRGAPRRRRRRVARAGRARAALGGGEPPAARRGRRRRARRRLAGAGPRLRRRPSDAARERRLPRARAARRARPGGAGAALDGGRAPPGDHPLRRHHRLHLPHRARRRRARLPGRGRRLRLLDEIARKHGGTVEKYLGDCVMALFGVPEALEDAPRAAVNAAIEMRRRVRAYSASVGGELPLDVHSGINTGMGIAGDISGPLIREFAVMGDPVSVADELKDLAPAGRVYVGNEVYRATREVFEYREVEASTRRQRTAPVRAFELLSEQERRYRARIGTERRVFSPLVGRDAELATLRRVVARLRAGEGGIASVVAEAGLGKSRVVAELAASEEARGVGWREGRSVSTGQHLSFHTIADLCRSFAEIAEDDDDARARAKLEALVRRLLGDDADEALPFIATLLGLHAEGAAAARIAALHGDALEKLILRSVTQVVRAASRLGPVVLVLMDDLHWADLSSIGILESLLRLTDEHPILFLQLFRPGFAPTSEHVREQARVHHAERYVEVELRPLDAPATRGS